MEKVNLENTTLLQQMKVPQETEVDEYTFNYLFSISPKYTVVKKFEDGYMAYSEDFFIRDKIAKASDKTPQDALAKFIINCKIRKSSLIKE